MSEPNAVDYEGKTQLADTRTIVATSGWVDCWLCGHPVNVLKAHRLECSAGPTFFMHGTCLERIGPATVAKKYQTAVWGVALNASDHIRQTKIVDMYARRTKR